MELVGEETERSGGALIHKRKQAIKRGERERESVGERETRRGCTGSKKNAGRGEKLAPTSSANDAWGENEAELDGGRREKEREMTCLAQTSARVQRKSREAKRRY